jgi:glycogen debranching enzyme
MPLEISVGAPLLTINQGTTFMVTDLNGQIAADSDHGVFADDTRFVSYYEISADGNPWRRLSSAATTHYASRAYLVSDAFETEAGAIPGGTVSLVISRTIDEGIHEDLDITNFGLTPVKFNLEIALRSDFADIFEVKSHKFVRRGRIVTEWDEKQRTLRTSYSNRDFERVFAYRLSDSGSPPVYANGRITFPILLGSGASWRSCCEYIFGIQGRMRRPLRCYDHASRNTRVDELEHQWMAQATALTSANEDVYRLYRQSVEDIGALRLHDHDYAPDVWMPAAGVPWFVTIFGRDSLIVSLQNMLVHPGFARGALKKLAELQATERDDWRDAQPGKIPHEIRFGELAHLNLIPHTPYYGTADATALYLIVLHEAWKWLGDRDLLREFRNTALRCLEWIDQSGDLDGDGFQEYQTRSAQGYENMGWKDAGDAVVHPDGTLVQGPKALCELQGYTFDAWMRSAELFDVLGEPERAATLRAKAARLQTRFEDRFWCEDIGSYAFTLDRDKQPVKTVASNPGHCLWSGMIRPDRARRVVQRLLRPDMWSGWGIRTLSALNPAYNPFSYQCGSVWPHDNSLIALGFKRYGFAAEVARIARDISEAASYFASYRLPELYAGVQREGGTFPVQYPGANVPQAWASGANFQLLQAVLGIQADAPSKRLYVDPELPPWLPDVTLHGLRVGEAKVDLTFFREGERTRWDAKVLTGRIEVQAQAWQPWLIDKVDQPSNA